jgi:heptose I phosphotransferase
MPPAATRAQPPRTTPGTRAATPQNAADNEHIWIEPTERSTLAGAGLDTVAQVMATDAGRCLRALRDRENWRLDLPDGAGKSRGAFLKKHHVRGLGNWLRAKLGLRLPATAGRTEAENNDRLERAGIPAMRTMAFGERLLPSGLLESFVLTEELTGFTQLDHYLRKRFAELNTTQHISNPDNARQDASFARLSLRVAAIAGRFHRAGFNHRDLYCCHFFIREEAAGDFEVRMIDLQRVQHRTRLRRRWIVKDLAQLHYSAPREWVSCSRQLAFFKQYLGVERLRPQDKRLLRSVLRKRWFMERKLGPCT